LRVSILIPAAMPLTDSQIRNAKPLPDKSLKLTDSEGLYLEVRKTGAKLWRYRYRIAGKENVFAVGEYAQVPSGEAKEQTQSRRNRAPSRTPRFSFQSAGRG